MHINIYTHTQIAGTDKFSTDDIFAPVNLISLPFLLGILLIIA